MRRAKQKHTDPIVIDEPSVANLALPEHTNALPNTIHNTTTLIPRRDRPRPQERRLPHPRLAPTIITTLAYSRARTTKVHTRPERARDPQLGRERLWVVITIDRRSRDEYGGTERIDASATGEGEGEQRERSVGGEDGRRSG